MNVLESIYDWSQSLHEWQRDALRRALEKGILKDQDIDDLRALVKSSVGITDAKKRQPLPLAKEQIPAASASGQPVVLKALENVKSVNAIADGQELVLSEQGLTVIYGDNGSGKSGYVRVMKHALRARDQDEAVLPNVFDSAKRAQTPSAAFRIVDKQGEHVVRWEEGKPASEVLSAISVFDSRCARVYIDKENDVAYVPYGLDLLVELARVSQVIKEKLNDEIQANSVDPDLFKHLIDDTEVGRCIQNLSAETEIEQIDKLCTLSPQEQSRLKELRKALKENDPSARIAALQRLDIRSERLASSVKRAESMLDDAGMAKIQRINAEWASAKKAADIAKQRAFDDPKLLRGTGGDEWKELFNAARRFSESAAYPSKPFPVTKGNARCVLCQQELLDGALRLKSFQEFLEADLEKALQEKQQQKRGILANLDALPVGDVLVDDETISEIAAASEACSGLLDKFKNWSVKRAAAARRILEGKAAEIGDAVTGVSDSIAQLRRTIAPEISALKAAASAENRPSMERELAALQARTNLDKEKEAVKRAVRRIKTVAKLEDAARLVSTTGISKKATELNDAAVTEALKLKLNEEFASLGAEHLKMKLEKRTSKGRTLHKLRLDLKIPRDVSLSNVLSEGEQRAIAIGSFLAEVNLDGASSGIVFDDPVSSLDHTRRELVASRLIKEAAKRQVIVFTHDLYFLFLLLDGAAKSNVEHRTLSVNAWAGEAGIIHLDVPFRGKTVRDRVGELRALQQKAEKAHKQGQSQQYELMVRDGYERLRESWERSIEEVLFAGVVQRFKQGLESQMLHSVQVEDADYTEVSAGMTRCSTFAHDQSVHANPPMPTPAEFLRDIELLEAFRTRIEERRKGTLARRKALVSRSR